MFGENGYTHLLSLEGEAAYGGPALSSTVEWRILSAERLALACQVSRTKGLPLNLYDLIKVKGLE